MPLTSQTIRWRLTWVAVVTALFAGPVVACDRSGASSSDSEKEVEPAASPDHDDEDDGVVDEKPATDGAPESEADGASDEPLEHRWLTDEQGPEEVSLYRADAAHALYLLAKISERQVIALGTSGPLLVSGSWAREDVERGLETLVDAMDWVAGKEVDVPGVEQDLLLVSDREAFEEDLDLAQSFADVGDDPVSIALDSAKITNILRLVLDVGEPDDGFTLSTEDIEDIPTVTALVSDVPLSAFLEAVTYATGATVDDSGDKPAVTGFASFASPRTSPARCPQNKSPFQTNSDTDSELPILEVGIDDLHLSAVRPDESRITFISDGSSISCRLLIDPYFETNTFVTRPSEKTYHLWELDEFDNGEVTATNSQTLRDGELSGADRSVVLEFPDVSKR